MLHGGASLIKSKTCEHHANDGVEYTVKRTRKAAATANAGKLQMKRQRTMFPKTKTKTRQESKTEGREKQISRGERSYCFKSKTLVSTEKR